uniref:Uncharacterized protein n=1 Tax=Oryza sativa subsp. japonica TaxID=39947 RepID=Q6K8C1_ORYSJ|nr:hypothetical protein [Oryza sativa Japonica Group]BAD21708.1 hypothetical protein [Oryza sativa Japonica Group]
MARYPDLAVIELETAPSRHPNTRTSGNIRFPFPIPFPFSTSSLPLTASGEHRATVPVACTEDLISSYVFAKLLTAEALPCCPFLELEHQQLQRYHHVLELELEN